MSDHAKDGPGAGSSRSADGPRPGTPQTAAGPDAGTVRSVPVPEILAGQKALITGGGAGIGAACVRALAEAGADVAVNYRSDADSAESIAEYARSLSRTAITVKADVSVEEQVESMVSAVIEQLGTVDILVNNAGLQADAPFDEMTLEQWNRVMSVNLTGPFLCSRAVVREFKGRGVAPRVSSAAGKIINMSSVHDAIPWAGHVNYAASKGGLQMFTRSIAQELAPYRIRVLALSPGAIRTNINRPAWENEEAYDNLMKLIPLNRIGEPSDVGRVLAWLASDFCDYVTGTTMYVDGGMMLYPAFAEGG